MEKEIPNTSVNQSPNKSEEKNSQSVVLSLPESSSTAIKKSLIFAFAIAAIALLVNGIIRLDFLLYGTSISETSITENAQQVMLGISSIAFFRIAKENKAISQAAMLISGFFAVLFIRELDFLFDMLHHGSWKYPAILIALSVIYFAYKEGKNTLNQMAYILNMPSMRLVILGTMMLLVFTRLFGMGSFWQSVMQDNYIRDVKNIAEEGSELLFYCIIALGSLMTHFSFIKLKNKTPFSA